MVAHAECGWRVRVYRVLGSEKPKMAADGQIKHLILVKKRSNTIPHARDYTSTTDTASMNTRLV